MIRVNDLLNRLRKIKFVDLVHIFMFILAIIPACIYRRKHKKMWLICEESNTARCNGYYFYNFLRIQHPDEDVVYAIGDCYDSAKVKKIGKTVRYGTFRHWVLYLAAKYNVSSQKGGKPNAAVCYFLEVCLGINTNRIFLQHGITINEGRWLHYDVSKFNLFICGARPEYEFIRNNFGYKSDSVVYTGFARWDYLWSHQTKKNRIIIMPTWREWLDTKDKFLKSSYYDKWKSILENEELKKMIKEKNLEVIFYPHKEMQPYISLFKKCNSDCIIADMSMYDVQYLLGTGELLITDYSSVFFDFLYLKKNVVFYQFDKNEYRKKQYQRGWFDYEGNELTVWCEDEKDLISIIKDLYQDEFRFKNEQLYYEYFPLSDAHNCERIYNEIIKRK